jgi:hypothetical protein
MDGGEQAMEGCGGEGMIEPVLNERDRLRVEVIEDLLSALNRDT